MTPQNNTLSNESITSSIDSDTSDHHSDHDSTREERSTTDQCCDLDPRGIRTQGINTCGQLYWKWQHTRPELYKNAPKHGLYFDVEYYDTKYLYHNQKTIVFLHGAPGTYKDFSSQINYFAQRGYRVIAPNFPDYSAGAPSFRHSTKERYYYIEDFFRAIGLTKIDIIVGHSSAVYVLFELLEKSQYLQIDSIGLFNNPGYKLPEQLQITNSRIFFMQLYDNHKFLRPILKFTFAFLMQLNGVVKVDKLDNLLLACSCMIYSDHTNLERQYKLIRTKKIPTFIVISDRDKLIPSEYFDMVLEDLEATTNHICYYDSDGNLVKPRSNGDDYVKVVNFQSGGHYSFQNYANAVNVEMEQFIQNL